MNKPTKISVPSTPYRSAGKLKKQPWELKEDNSILREAWEVIISVYEHLKKTKNGKCDRVEEYRRKLWLGKLEYEDLEKLE